jgi:hypothetical protein
MSFEMIDLQTLEKFHQHLLAIQRAGFELTPMFLGQANSDPSSSVTTSQQLEKLLSQILDEAKQSRQSIESLLATRTDLNSQYVSSLQTWLANDQKLSSLEHLLVESELAFASHCGSKFTLLQLGIYAAICLTGLTIVLNLSLKGMLGLIKSLQLAPPQFLSVMLQMSAYYGWLIAAFVVGVVALGYTIVRTFGSRNRLKRSRAYIALQHSLQAGRLAIASQTASNSNSQQMQAASSAPAGYQSSPLINWASSQLDSRHASNGRLFRLIEKLYLIFSYQHGRRSSAERTTLLSVIIGGGMALLTGVLLFYPLVQLWMLVVDNSGATQ